MDKIFPIRVPVLKIIQPLGEFYAAVLSANILLQVTYSDPLRLLGFSNEGAYELQGHQRKLVKERLRIIGRYIDTVEAAFPNSIILAANYCEDGTLEESEKRWSIESDGTNNVLVIPSAKKLAAIVDGQHRLYGFQEATINDRLDMPLLCSIYLDLPNPFQAYLFATINYNQKPVDKSQSYELYGFNLEDEPPVAWSPEKTAVFLCRKLNTDESSVFKNHIIVTAQQDDAVNGTAKLQKKIWAVSTATIVEGVLKLFSSNPKRDRDIMHRTTVDKGRDRKVLDDRDKSPLRKQYLDCNDLLIFTLTKNYFNAVSNVLWTDISDSIIRKTVGIQALFDILKQVCHEAIIAKDISYNFFKQRIAPCKEINFSNAFFEASGRGRQRIRNAIELCLNLKQLNAISEGDRQTYKEICHIK